MFRIFHCADVVVDRCIDPGNEKLLLKQIFDACINSSDKESLLNDVRVVSALIEREQLASTASGMVAFPHAKVETIKVDGVLLACRFRTPTDWFNSFDNQRISACFLNIYKPEFTELHLKLTVKLHRIVRANFSQIIEEDSFESFLKKEVYPLYYFKD